MLRNFELVCHSIYCIWKKKPGIPGEEAEEVDIVKPAKSTDINSYPMRIKGLLKQCAEMLVVQSIQVQCDGLEKEFRSSMTLLDSHEFSCRVTIPALKQFFQSRRNKQVELPKRADIASLNDFLDSNIEELIEADLTVRDNYIKAMKFFLTKKIVYNKKRAGEVSRIELDDLIKGFKTSSCCDDELFEGLSEDHRKAANKHLRLEFIGKKGRVVAALVTKPMEELALKLLPLRIQNFKVTVVINGILQESRFFFHLPGCVNEMNPWSILRSMCNSLGIEHMNSTLLR
jgi:hypothetical protein